MTREEAKREILFAKREVMADSWIDKAYDVAIKALEEPEIVRCKDCQYHIPQYGRCRWWCQFVDPSEWCSRAKRKGGEADD